MSEATVGEREQSTAYVGHFVTLRFVRRTEYEIFRPWLADIRKLRIWSLPGRGSGANKQLYEELDKLLRQSFTLVAFDNPDGQSIGFLQAYNINLVDGWAMVQTYFAPEWVGLRSSEEACLAFVELVFTRFDLRKIYVDLQEFRSGMLGSTVEAACSEEGRFGQHTLHDGRLWDVKRLALYREAWPEARDRASFLVGTGAEAEGLLEEASTDSA